MGYEELLVLRDQDRTWDVASLWAWLAVQLVLDDHLPDQQCGFGSCHAHRAAHKLGLATFPDRLFGFA